MLFARVSEMLTNGERGVLVTVLQSTPLFQLLKGSHWIWCNDQLELVDGVGEQGKFTWEETVGTLGGSEQVGQGQWQVGDVNPAGLKGYGAGWDAVALKLTQVCQQILEQGSFMRQKVEVAEEWLDVTFEPILPRPRLIILGAGHVGQALAKQAHLVEMSVVVVDDRPDFASGHLYPEGVQVICGDFLQVIDQLRLTENDYLVIVTRGHQYDRNCLLKVAGMELAYVGMIGSRRRVAGLFQELKKQGVDPCWLERVHSPIGLDIGAETPQEIGVSILAELIQVMRKGADPR